MVMVLVVVMYGMVCMYIYIYHGCRKSGYSTRSDSFLFEMRGAGYVRRMFMYLLENLGISDENQCIVTMIMNYQGHITSERTRT